MEHLMNAKFLTLLHLQSDKQRLIGHGKKLSEKERTKIKRENKCHKFFLLELIAS